MSDRERAKELSKQVTFVASLYGLAPDKTDGKEVVEANAEAILDALAAVREEEREKAVRIAIAEAEKHRLNDDPCRMDACKYVASAIRAQTTEGE